MSGLVGTQVGNIRLVDLLGRGGMGEVYVGFDTKLDRKVAVKAIRPEHRLDEEAKARLLREARALSRLDHPNICRIYDYVEGSERDLLVLEFIAGRTLTRVVREGIGRAEALRVAEQVARVLEAAHEANIVHRDLKPDNVMLTAGGTVKVLDFGISRSLDDEVAATMRLGDGGHPAPADADSTHVLGTGEAEAAEGDSVVHTRAGSVLGTVAYMSPEQARGEAVTPASDMYAFGLVLQELLTGSPPLPTKEPAPVLLVQAAEGKSAEVTGLDRELTDLIRRLKSLSPGARPSASEALARLQWIRARPRRRLRRLAAAAAVLVVVLASAKYAVDVTRERNAAIAAREAAVQARLESEEVVRYLMHLFDVSDPSEARGSTVTARELLDRGAEQIRKELADQPRARGRLLATMGVVYRKLGLFEEAEGLLEEALTVQEAVLPADHPQVARSLDELASLYLQQGRFSEAAPLYRRAIEIFENLEGQERDDLAGRLNNLATVYRRLGRLDEAERMYRRALVLKEEAFGPEHPSVASTLKNLANICYQQERYDEAERLCRRALAIREAALPADHPDLASTLDLLANITWQLGSYDEAERLYRRALEINEKVLGPDHPQLGVSVNNLATLDFERGKYAEAERLYRQALTIFETALGPQHERVIYPLLGLANVCREQGRTVEAEGYYQRALAVCDSALPPDHPNRQAVAAEYAKLLRSLGRGAEAEALESPSS